MNRWKDWYQQEKRDLEKALFDNREGFYEWACFTAQQATEKVVKSLGLKLKIELWRHSMKSRQRRQ